MSMGTAKTGGDGQVEGGRRRPARGRRGRVLGILLSLAALQLGSLAAPAHACGCGAMVPNADTRIGVDQETSAVRWDGRRERIDMRLTVRGTADQAAWIMPVPHRADVELGDPALFDRLSEATAPVPRDRFYFWPRGGDWPFADSDDDGAGAPAPGASDGRGSGVGVVDRRRLGDFEVARLTATDPDALSTWLSTNGFRLPDRLEDALQPYVAQGWEYVAIRLVPGEADGSGASGTPDTGASPGTSGTPGVNGSPDAGSTPDASGHPGSGSTSDASGSPDAGPTPDAVGGPDTGEFPDASSTPGTTGTSGTTVAPGATGTTGTPGASGTPGSSETPARPQPLTGALDPLRITFDSDRLVYPMRLSRLARTPQSLGLYVFAPHRMEPRSAIGGAEPEVTFAGKVEPTGALAELAGGGTPFLTAVEQDFPQPERINADHELRRSASDTTFRRTYDRDRLLRVAGMPAWLLTVGGVALVAVLLIVVRARARARRDVLPPA
ncbi:DUF2330 domain-containing protein [Streptomyces sp. NBC_01304]|uniref:DUF2330 domain-containing protein n=1 Tax=Streptomyces sp. NBC_01304 TaxID=2903818 RepID=UPI003FA38E00|nr:DUF2330 domain-containing protein [Streptomyces sp. NBC_01304]